MRKGTKSKKSNEDDPGPDVVMVARASGAALGFHRIQTIRGQAASTQVPIAHYPACDFQPSNTRLPAFLELSGIFGTQQDACQGAEARKKVGEG